MRAITEIKIRRYTVIFLLLGLLTCTGSPSPRAMNYYVRPSGDNANSGTVAEPFETIEHAIYVLEAGDTLYIGEGTYHEGELYPSVNATPGNPVTIRNIPGETPVLDGQSTLWNFVELIEKDGFVFEGLTLQGYKSGALSCRHTGYVAIRRCILRRNGTGGIELNYASYPHAAYDAHMTVEDCVCYENGWGDGWASGIHLNNKSQGGANSHHVIQRNICYNNYDGSDHHTDGNGIMFDMGGGGSALIANNLCYNNGGAGIRVMDGTALVLNNTCYRNGWDPDNPYQPPEIELIERHLSGSVVGTIVRNNILWARSKREFYGAWYGGPFGLDTAAQSDFVFDHNLLWSDTPAEASMEAWMLQCVSGNPFFETCKADDARISINGALFLDMEAENYNFHLTNDSPAVDLGSPEQAPADDLDNTPRDASPDAGAYERGLETTRAAQWYAY